MDIPRYIVVEGPIGVGKTTLVTQLAKHLRARRILETFEENPFLPLFYQDKARYAFQTETFFLLSRYRQQEELAQPDLFTPHIVSDYLFVKTRLFASETLNDEEFRLYDKMYHLLEQRVPQPDLVVYLHAPVDVLLRRIGRRGREMEVNMDPSYLTSLCQIYSRYFSNFTQTPLLMVDTTSFNFADEPGSLQHLLDAIAAMRGPFAHLTSPSTLELNVSF